MAKTTTNSVQLSYKVETTEGTVPTGAYKIIPFTGGAPEFSLQYIESEAISTSRAVSNSYLTGQTVNGTINFEMSHAHYATFLREVIRSSTTAAVTHTSYYPSTDGYDTDKYYGPTDARKTYTFIKKVTEGSGANETTNYFVYPGCVIKSMTIDSQLSSLVKGTMTIVGSTEYIYPKNATSTGQPLDGVTFTPVAAYYLYNTTTDLVLLNFDVGGTVFPVCATSFSITIDNNTGEGFCLGKYGAQDLRDYAFNVSGSAELYFDIPESGVNQIYNAHRTGATIAIKVVWLDSAPSPMIISFNLEQVKLESATVPVQGRNQYVMMPITFKAIADTNGKSVMLHLGQTA